MNQNQREFLIKHVEKTYRNQKDAMDESKPKEPSLNNYLIAAVLDGSFQLQEPETIRKAIKELVLNLGPEGSLIGGRGRNRYSDYDVEHQVKIQAESLFVLPGNYLAALAEYEQKRSDWDAQQKQLEDYKETIILKIQIGSAQVLSKLIEQVDNLADLSIVNTSLLLTAPDETKKLKA